MTRDNNNNKSRIIVIIILIIMVKNEVNIIVFLVSKVYDLFMTVFKKDRQCACHNVVARCVIFILPQIS